MSRCVTTQVSVNSHIRVIKNDSLSLLLVTFSIKANFKKSTCGNPSTKGFLGLLNQVLAFVTLFSQVKKYIIVRLCCCFTKPLILNYLHQPLLYSLIQITRIISISFKLLTPALTFTLKLLV